MRDRLEQKLNELVDLDVIERSKGPIPLISPVVVVPKPIGDICLCVDMRQLMVLLYGNDTLSPQSMKSFMHDLNGITVLS